MKLFLALAAVFVSISAFAPSSVLAPERQEPAAHTDEHSVLEDRMHVIEDQLKLLRRSLRDATKDTESLAALATLEAAAVTAKSEQPRMLPHVPEAERARFISDYRREMITLLESALSVERALLDEKREAALAAFEKLRDLEDPAHARFTEEEK